MIDERLEFFRALYDVLDCNFKIRIKIQFIYDLFDS